MRQTGVWRTVSRVSGLPALHAPHVEPRGNRSKYRRGKTPSSHPGRQKTGTRGAQACPGSACLPRNREGESGDYCTDAAGSSGIIDDNGNQAGTGYPSPVRPCHCGVLSSTRSRSNSQSTSNSGTDPSHTAHLDTIDSENAGPANRNRSIPQARGSTTNPCTGPPHTAHLNTIDSKNVGPANRNRSTPQATGSTAATYASPPPHRLHRPRNFPYTNTPGCL